MDKIKINGKRIAFSTIGAFFGLGGFYIAFEWMGWMDKDNDTSIIELLGGLWLFLLFMSLLAFSTIEIVSEIMDYLNKKTVTVIDYVKDAFNKKSLNIKEIQKIVFILSAFVIAISFAYFFVYLPHNKKSLTKECHAIASEKAKTYSGYIDEESYDKEFEWCLNEKGL